MDMNADNPEFQETLRVIKTARTEEAINKAAKAGCFPLMKAVTPSEEIRSKFCVWQHRETKEIQILGDFRAGPGNDAWEQVIDWTYYYPYTFPKPFAAYLIPPDIKEGEKVILDDLIEDFIGMSWNQGNNYRLKSCPAIWDGKDLKIQYDASKHLEEVIG